MTDNNSVILEKRGQAFWITINRPDKRNAINADVVAGIVKGYRDAHDDNDVRVIVLTGAGEKAFCAGADLQNSGAAFAFDFSRPNGDYADLLRLSQSATKPAVARVNGVCMAGGMGLLCMTDMAVAADHVIFGLPEVKVGVFPMQVLSLLQSSAPPRQIRHARDCLDVVRREHRLYRKPDRTARHDRRRKGRAEGVCGEAQA